MSTHKDIESHGGNYELIQDTHEEQKGNKNKYSKVRNNEEESPIVIENELRNEETLKKLWIVSVICLIFMGIEVTGGYLANSIAIMSDAAHLLSDFLGFIISIVSIYISRRGATHYMSFGYHRAEVIGALVSITLIWGLTIWLLYEATLRIIHRGEVDGLIMLITAVIGFFFNVVMGLILAYQGIDHNLHGHGHEEHEVEHDYFEEDNTLKEHGHGHAHDDNHGHGHDDEDHVYHGEGDHEHDHNHKHNLDHKHPHKVHNPHKREKHIHHVHVHKKHHEKKEESQAQNHGHSHDHQNVNLRAAIIHVVGDALQNLGVVIAGLIIYIWPSASIADPICTFIFSIIVGFTTIRILKECISVLMEGSPLEFKMVELEKDLKNIKGVQEIHDLHVWSLSVGKLSLSCHITSNNPQISLRKARLLIKNKYKITHSTIQVELDSDDLKEDCKHDLHHEVQSKTKKNN